MNIIFHQTFDQPLRKYPHYDGSSLIFAYEDVDYDEETGTWGIATLNIETGQIERQPSPFQVDCENIFPEDISWNLYGLHNGSFIFVLSWETSYEKAYQFVRWDKEQWSLLEKTGLNHVHLTEQSIFRPLKETEIITMNDYYMSGGGIHAYKVDETFHVAIDASHAFEHDNSPTAVKHSYEDIKAKHPAYYSNLELIELREYNKTAQLPDGIPEGHPALDRNLVWEMKVAHHNDLFFLFFDSFRQRGILDILILKE